MQRLVGLDMASFNHVTSRKWLFKHLVPVEIVLVVHCHVLVIKISDS